MAATAAVSGRCASSHRAVPVAVGYGDPKSVVPRDMTVAMTVKKGTGKKDIKLTIPNQDITPQKEAALKKQLNTGLKAAGCPTA
ncbi:hypothetical protein CG747_38550 [Streptomyces sp. CB02959]|uniref:hypothetical protein n=1 Tax=Streptomyces sp. CB02959 TaxID=2020330 RepID=UPI000C274E76|nr:hypothetical protein [Streptomyces sp. CB02959]PJN35531.1 hypothetical protein CG747_38550 [Streptomyces sp. CB02959]